MSICPLIVIPVKITLPSALIWQDEFEEREERAKARAAGQRVLDITFLTERIRQEERRRRVALARQEKLVGTRAYSCQRLVCMG